MSQKVILILIDGMRSDAVARCSHPFIRPFTDESIHISRARTVMPSVTLPCHFSLFHSAPPERHGILTNTYTPPARPLSGLTEQLKLHQARTAFFYNWEPLRDLAAPGSLDYSLCMAMRSHPSSDLRLCQAAIDYAQEQSPDFIFLYLGETDEVGHQHGWMTEAYLTALHAAWQGIEKVAAALQGSYHLIVTADHGGHERTHGTDSDEDMLIPLWLPRGFGAVARDPASILDIAPTITRIMGHAPAADWEGVSLLTI